MNVFEPAGPCIRICRKREQFRLVQTGSADLRVRLLTIAGENPDFVWRAVRGQIANALGQHGLSNVRVERGEEAPEQSAGGKYRQIIPLAREAA